MEKHLGPEVDRKMSAACEIDLVVSMKTFINFANETFARQQRFAVRMAKIFGSFDKIISYGPNDIDKQFYERNKRTLDVPKGAGLFLWKPYFISRTLENANEGEYVFYVDSGFFITGTIDRLIKELDKSGQDIMAFSTYYPEEQWTKRRLFENMGCSGPDYSKTNQFMATMSLIRNSQASRSFFSELVELSMDCENISDASDDEANPANFIEHRYDQSIFSLLCKKRGLTAFRPPFVFGELGAAYAVMKKTEATYGKAVEFNFKTFDNSSYPTILQVNKSFKAFGMELNAFLISYLYLKLLNVLPFRSKAYDFLVGLGVRWV